MGKRQAQRRELKEALKRAAQLQRAARTPEAYVVQEGELELHEAAHAVAALLLIGPSAIERLYLAPARPPRVIRESELGTEPDAGSLTFVDDPEINTAVSERWPAARLSSELIQRARGRTIANLAGVYGSALARQERFVRVLVPVGGDMAQIQALTHLLTDWNAEEAKRLYVELEAEARAFVSSHEKAIRAVGEQLAITRELGPEAIDRIVRSAEGVARTEAET